MFCLLGLVAPTQGWPSNAGTGTLGGWWEAGQGGGRERESKQGEQIMGGSMVAQPGEGSGGRIQPLGQILTSVPDPGGSKLTVAPSSA